MLTLSKTTPLLLLFVWQANMKLVSFSLVQPKHLIAASCRSSVVPALVAILDGIEVSSAPVCIYPVR